MSIIANEAKRDRTRLLKSISMMVLYLVLGFAYLWPDEFVRNPASLALSGRSSVIVYVENLTRFPIWGAAFLLGATSLFAALTLWRKFLPSAHLICACIAMGYAASSWTTAVINPGTYIITAALATFVLVLNLILMISYTAGPSYISALGEDVDIGDDYELEVDDEDWTEDER